jgi:hypothetical protein
LKSCRAHEAPGPSTEERDSCSYCLYCRISAPRKKRTFSAAQRKEQAKRMKAYWTAKKKAK